MAAHRQKKRPRPNCTRSWGFSLLEVLVATALMGLVMVVLLQVLGAGLRGQQAVRQNALALNLAEQVLQTYCTERTLEAGSYEGREGAFDYRVRVTPQYEVSDGAGRKLTCSLIQVSVFWRQLGRVKRLDLETMRTTTPRGA